MLHFINLFLICSCLYASTNYDDGDEDELVRFNVNREFYFPISLERGKRSSTPTRTLRRAIQEEVNQRSFPTKSSGAINELVHFDGYLGCSCASFVPISFEESGRRTSSPSRTLRQVTQEETNKRNSPTNSLSADRFIIKGQHFYMVGLKRCFAENLVEVCGDPEIMKHFCSNSEATGQPWSRDKVYNLCDEYEKELNRAQHPTKYGWAIITGSPTKEEVSGVIFVFHSPLCSKIKASLKATRVREMSEVKEIARILARNAQGRGLGANILNCMAEYLYKTDLVAQSHKNNKSSEESRKKSGFITVDLQDGNPTRVYQWRISEYCKEGKELIRFSYSGNEVSIATLRGEMSLFNLLKVSARGLSVSPLTGKDLENAEVKTFSAISLPNITKKNLSKQEQKLQEIDTRRLPQILAGSPVDCLVSTNDARKTPLGMLRLQASSPTLPLTFKFIPLYADNAVEIGNEVGEVVRARLENHRIVPREERSQCIFSGFKSIEVVKPGSISTSPNTSFSRQGRNLVTKSWSLNISPVSIADIG